MSDFDDWTGSEDALILNGLRTGAGWESIADTLLRDTQEVIERAAELQRRADRRARLDALMGEDEDDEEDDEEDEDEVEVAQEPAAAVVPEAVRDEPQQTDDEPVQTVAPEPARTVNWIDVDKVLAPPTPTTGQCRICTKPIPIDDKVRRLYCSTVCAAEGKRLENLARYRDMKARMASPARVTTGNALACRGTYRQNYCCLRPRHSGDHLTDHGVIFSRDGRDQWRDVNDAYLMWCLNNDLVAPQG